MSDHTDDKTCMMNVDEQTATLTVVSGADRGVAIPVLLAVTTIGRSDGCDLTLTDTAASRQHCQLEATGDGRHELVDLGGGNGTAVNGRPVSRLVLPGTATILCGQTKIRYSRETRGGVTDADLEANSAGIQRIQRSDDHPSHDAKSHSGTPWVLLLLLVLGGVWFVGEYTMGWWNLAGLGGPTNAPKVVPVDVELSGPCLEYAETACEHTKADELGCYKLKLSASKMTDANCSLAKKAFEDEGSKEEAPAEGEQNAEAAPDTDAANEAPNAKEDGSSP
jgi:hypothetical protein